MVSVESIKRAASAATAHGYALSPEVAKAVEDIASPVYRVAVVGKFKVGKSTLINHVFLGDNPILSEGARFTAETAVSTEVESGDVSRLERYDWCETGGEKLVSTKDDPTEEDIVAATVGSSEAQRSELARTVSRIRLVTPNESLKGYTVIDTPGLDDPNKELLLNTTFRVIPGSDAALLVVEPKQLDQVEDDLLRKTLIEQGVSRVMVLVSYKPEDSDCRSRQMRCDVVETIKAQLSKIGRGDIPVEMYCFDSSIEDITNTETDLRLLIRSFLNDNALPGRLERVAFAVRQYLEDVELEIAAKIKASETSETEKAALSQKVEEQIAAFKAQCERAFRRLQTEMEDLKADAARRSESAVRRSFANLREKLDLASDVAAVRKILERAEDILRNDLDDRICTIGREMKSEIGSIVDRYASNLADAMSNWNRILLEEFKVDRPFLSRIPPIVFDAILVAVWNYFLPFGWLTALLGHLVGKNLGLSANVILKPVLVMQAKGKMSEAESQLVQQVVEQIRANADSAFFSVKEALEKYNQEQVGKMRKMAETEAVSSDRNELEQAKTDIQAALESLR